MRPIARIAALAALAAAGALALAACAGPLSGVRRHPEELREAPLCSACHEAATRPPLDHVDGWERSHGTLARQNVRTCELCHKPSWCADCHGAKEQIKPSDKRLLRPGSETPHRGDYTTRHRIDGRLDPGSCFACHGRKNDGRCAQCHR